MQLWPHVLGQSVLKVGLVLAKRLGWEEVSKHSNDMPCTWRLYWLAVERSALAGPFLFLVAQAAIETTPLLF